MPDTRGTQTETGFCYDDKILSVMSENSSDISFDPDKGKMYLNQFISLIKGFNSPHKP